MFQKNIYSVRLIFLGCLLGMGALVSCIREDLDACAPVGVRVVTGPLSWQDAIEEQEVQKVRMYIFDENLLLLEARDSELNKPEFMNYPGRKLHVVTLANTLDRVLLTEPSLKESKEKGMIALLPGDPYSNLEPYLVTDDVIWGEMDVNTLNTTQVEKIFDLPIRRITAGVLVRLYGLDAYAKKQQWNEPFAVVLESRHEKADFYGRSHIAESGYVQYVPLLQAAPANYRDVYECPGRDFGNQYVNILGADESSRIDVFIYSGDQLVYSTKSKEELDDMLTVRNGRMHLIEMYFKDGGGEVDPPDPPDPPSPPDPPVPPGPPGPPDPPNPPGPGPIDPPGPPGPPGPDPNTENIEIVARQATWTVIPPINVIFD